MWSHLTSETRHDTFRDGEGRCTEGRLTQAGVV